MYGISEITVRRINRGEAPYCLPNFQYPIREKNKYFCQFS